MAVSILGMAEGGTKGGRRSGGPMALDICFLLPRGQATKVFLSSSLVGGLASYSVSEKVSWSV